MATILVACGTPSVRDFGGRWRPVNAFDKEAVEIPLATSYVFYAAPMDGTLKTMLTRWSKDSGLVLSYQLPNDYSLVAATARIHTPNPRAAAAELNAIYAKQRVSVIVNARQIIVQPSEPSVGPDLESTQSETATGKS